MPSFWLSASQVRERLLAEGHISKVEEVSLKSIHQVARDTGFAEVRRLLRRQFKFTFLEHHYPKLVNAVENPLVPLTNNTVEGQLRWHVSRRFDQHYQNMCGFDSIETARKYLYLFELS